MAEKKPKQVGGDDDFVEAAFGLAGMILAAYGLYKLVKPDKPSPQERRILEMEQEIARIYPGEHGW